ncbi:MAG: helix-turn-helix domain-containing protein [Pseudomonadota bacterium]
MAARSVMAETSIDAVTIDEIIQKAEVGKGSFYNHFASKDALFLATMEQVVADMARRITSVSHGTDDPAEVMAIGIRIYVELATVDPEIGRFLINAPARSDMLSRHADPVVNKTIDDGLRANRFRLRNRELFFALLTSGVTATLQGRLENRFDANVGSELAASVLQLAGLDADEAVEIAFRPLPTA